MNHLEDQNNSIIFIRRFWLRIQVIESQLFQGCLRCYLNSNFVSAKHKQTQRCPPMSSRNWTLVVVIIDMNDWNKNQKTTKNYIITFLIIDKFNYRNSKINTYARVNSSSISSSIRFYWNLNNVKNLKFWIYS